MQLGSMPTRAMPYPHLKPPRLRSSGHIGGRPGCGTPNGRSRTPPPSRPASRRRSEPPRRGRANAEARGRVRTGGTVAKGSDDSPTDKEDEMPLLRGSHDGGTKYRMREKLFSIGDDYWIENEEDERAFKVDGKALRVRDTLVLEDTSGAELFSVQEKKLRVRDTMEVEREGQTVATVKKAMITP